MGLGSLRTTSLSLAREKADAARRLLAAGVDPIEHRKQELRREAAAVAQLKRCAKSAGSISQERGALVDEKHRREWKSSLDRFVHPVIGNVAIADVEVGHVLKVIEPHWHRMPETARDVLGRIEELIDFARVAGLRRDDSNPARNGAAAWMRCCPRRRGCARRNIMPPCTTATCPDFMAQAARRARHLRRARSNS